MTDAHDAAPDSEQDGPGSPAASGSGDFVALHAAAVRDLQRWDAPDLAQEFMTEAFLDLLGSGPAAVHRDGLPRHLTASAVVLDPTGTRVLLTLHRKARQWCQFGGHLELGDASLHAAATREAREESGIPDLVLDPGIAQLSTHDLAAAFGRCRTHYDVRFAGTAPLDGTHAISDESLDVRWWPVDDLPGDATPDMPTLVAAARRHLHLP